MYVAWASTCCKIIVNALLDGSVESMHDPLAGVLLVSISLFRPHQQLVGLNCRLGAVGEDDRYDRCANLYWEIQSGSPLASFIQLGGAQAAAKDQHLFASQYCPKQKRSFDFGLTSSQSQPKNDSPKVSFPFCGESDLQESWDVLHRQSQLDGCQRHHASGWWNSALVARRRMNITQDQYMVHRPMD